MGKIENLKLNNGTPIEKLEKLSEKIDRVEGDNGL